jgi:hypothetical protein
MLLVPETARARVLPRDQSHICTGPCSPAVARRSPSGLNATARTCAMYSRKRTASSGRTLRLGRRRQRPTEPGTRIEEPVDIGVVLIRVRYITLGIVGDATGAPGWQLLPGQLLAVGGLNRCRPRTEGAEQRKVRLGIPAVDI